MGGEVPRGGRTRRARQAARAGIGWQRLVPRARPSPRAGAGALAARDLRGARPSVSEGSDLVRVRSLGRAGLRLLAVGRMTVEGEEYEREFYNMRESLDRVRRDE